MVGGVFRSVLVSVLVVGPAGCSTSATACPAMLHGASLTVRLAGGWTDGEPRSVRVRCPDGVACGRISPDGPREELVVTVSGVDGVLAELTVTPDWVRVGGTEECGGPTEAEVVVPAP
jgi:hypothetical protein